jgi:ABC-type phosphate transport system substrate-binding protein
MNIKEDRAGRLSAFFCLLIVASICPGFGPGVAVANDDLVIIANPNLSGGAIEQRELQRIYLGKKTLWEDNTSIVPVMLKSGSLHDEFIEGYIDRSVQRFVTYWRQMVFTGKGMPPKSFASESDLIDFVARTPGSVGFVSSSANVSSVKRLELE